MALYADVPEWLRITGNTTRRRRSETQNLDAYYRAHHKELTQEMREVAELEAAGEIVRDEYTRLHERAQRGKRRAASQRCESDQQREGVMQDLNTVAFTGQVVRDAELKTTNSGASILKFAVALNRSVKRGDQWEEEPSFIDCTLFGRIAAAIAQYMTKGTRVAVSGELEQQRWQDANGQNRSKVGIIARHVGLMGSPQGNRSSSSSSYPKQQEQAAPAYQQHQQEFEDDIPF